MEKPVRFDLGSSSAQHYIGALVFALVSVSAAADERVPSGWAQWRGPLATSVSPDGDPPIHWSEQRNVRFKVEIAGDGLASPVVWDDRIFVLSALPLGDETLADERAIEEVSERSESEVGFARVRFFVTAFSRADGSVVWQRIASEQMPHESHHLSTAWVCGSPITDGERVYAHFGSNGTYAYDMDGELLWQVDLGDMTTRLGYGEGSSPALFGDALVINWDHEGDSFVVALDGRTGRELWRRQRPGELTSWSTPLIVEHEGRPQVIIAAAGNTRGYDLSDGRELWSLSGLGMNVIPTPTYESGVIYLASGKRDSNRMQAVDLTAAAGVLDGGEALLWTRDHDTPYVATPLLYRGQLYFFKHTSSIFTAVDARTGETRFTTRLNLQSVYASPVAAAGRIYAFGRSGRAIVLRPGPELDVLAENELDDGFDASPAIVGDEMYLRGRRFLYAIARTDRQ